MRPSCAKPKLPRRSGTGRLGAALFAACLGLSPEPEIACEGELHQQRKLSSSAPQQHDVRFGDIRTTSPHDEPEQPSSGNHPCPAPSCLLALQPLPARKLSSAAAAAHVTLSEARASVAPDIPLETAEFCSSLMADAAARAGAISTLGSLDGKPGYCLDFLDSGRHPTHDAKPGYCRAELDDSAMRKGAGGRPCTHKLNGTGLDSPSQRTLPDTLLHPHAAIDAAALEAAAAVMGEEGLEVVPAPVPHDCQEQRLPASGHLAALTLVPSVLELLDGVSDLEPVAPATSLGGVWTGVWNGERVAVKLIAGNACGWRSPEGPGIVAAARSRAVAHPNLLRVYDVRFAAVDERCMELLRPPPRMRPHWGSRAEASAAPSRLQALVYDYFGLPPYPGRATLMVYPGDVLPPLPVSAAQGALAALGLQLGGGAAAVLMQACEQGNLLTLACSARSPFRVSPTCRTWSAHAAQRALLRTAREIAGGVAALHAAGIAHGALKPSNVLLAASAADRRGFEARVADVGSWSQAFAAANPLACTQSLLLLPPEALEDAAEVVTPAADCYAFGCLLYVMAAGEMPFAGRHLAAALMAVIVEGARPEWPPCVHPHLAPLFERCMARDPRARPSFEQILVELKELEQQVKVSRPGARTTAA